ncbi:MAG: hypothetical protein AAFR69_08620, partial [Pseudomonadota bacterium]
CRKDAGIVIPVHPTPAMLACMKYSSPLFDIDDSLEAILRFADHCMNLSEDLHRRVMRLDFLKNDLGFVLSLAFMRLFVISSRLLDYASHPVPYRPRTPRASRAGEYRNRERSLAARLDDRFGILAQVNVLAVKGRHMIRRDQAARFGSQKPVFPGKRSADPGTVAAGSESVLGGPGSYARGHGGDIKNKSVFPGKRSADPGTVAACSVPQLRDPGSSPGIRGGVAKSGTVATECVSRVKAVFPGKRSADPGSVATSSAPKLRNPGTGFKAASRSRRGAVP